MEIDKFDGSDYSPERDDMRLTKQIDRVFKACSSGIPMTLAAISKATGDPEASVSAQLRHLRKPKHGSHTVDKLHIACGLYVYKVTPNEPNPST